MLNKQINIIEMEGGHANELRDQRATLVDELSKIVPTKVEEPTVITRINIQGLPIIQSRSTDRPW